MITFIMVKSEILNKIFYLKTKEKKKNIFIVT